MIIPFGIHQGKTYEEIPTDYLIFIAQGAKYFKGKHTTETTFKATWPQRFEAYRVLETRGYVRIGERIEGPDGKTYQPK